MKTLKKPLKQSTVKRKRRIVKNAETTRVRDYVFERERGMCRCCGWRHAESMHEIKSRGAGGKRTPENSIAVCGDGVRGCHGCLQRYQIRVEGPDAEQLLTFVATSSIGLNQLGPPQRRECLMRYVETR